MISYALTAGNPNGICVLYIENPRVFNFLVPDVDRYAAMVVSAYGLTLSNIGDLISANSIISTSVDYYPNFSLASSLSGKRCFYWGDLDYEGMLIYESLKKYSPAHSEWSLRYHGEAVARRKRPPLSVERVRGSC